MNVGDTLLELARASLVEAFGGAPVRFPDEAWLHEPGACFVTLSRKGELRGCVGTIEAHRPLGVDTVENARAAAFRDPRFPALDRGELVAVRIAVSRLGPLELVNADTEPEALSLLRPGVDGVVLTSGAKRGVFIPKMWEELPEPEVFLAWLKRKAGLPMQGWPRGTRLQRFTAEAWEEND